MSLIKTGNVGNFSNNVQKKLRSQLVERWEHVGAEFVSNDSTDLKLNESGEPVDSGLNFLKGLSDKDKLTHAILFENQATYLIKEITNSDSSGSFETVAFPMVRRIFSRLLANEIVSIQAMTQPSGQLFYFYPVISNRVDVTEDSTDYKAHTSPFAQNLATCVGANCPDTTYQNTKSLYDAYYGDELYDHSKGKFEIITATGQIMTLGTDGTFTAFTGSQLPLEDGTVKKLWFAINGFDGSNSGTSVGHTARLGGVGGYGLEIDTEEFLTSFLVTNVGDAIVDPSGNTIIATDETLDTGRVRFPAQKYGSSIVEYVDYCSADGTLYLELNLTKTTTVNNMFTVDGYVGAASGTTIAPTGLVFSWRRYEDLEGSTEMGEVSFEIKKVTVSVTSRKLRARWTPELAQDVEAYHNIDAEAELTALLSEQIAMEIDREILRDLKAAAAWKLRWNYRGWKTEGSQKYTEKEWKQTLITRVNQISAQIHKSTLRGGANFIVVSSEVSAIFDDLEAFAVSNAAPAEDQYNLGMRRMGTLNGRYTVYVDPYSKAGDILIGHKGTSILDTGYIYAPYVPLTLTPTLTDPNNFTNVKGIQTRYAKKVVNQRYYGKITVDHIPTFNINELR